MPDHPTAKKTIPPVVRNIVILLGAVFMFVGGLMMSGSVFPALGDKRILLGAMLVGLGAMDIMLGLVILSKQQQQHQQKQQQDNSPAGRR
jgi:predicted phage tail protein